MTAGGTADPLDWYYVIAVGGIAYFVAGDGSITTTPTPLVTGIPALEFANVALLDVSLPPGTVATFPFLLLDGAELVAFDFDTVVVNP